MNRNHYMALGTILLLVGLTIFKIENVTLTEETTKFLAQQTAEEGKPDPGPFLEAVPMKKTVAIPTWPRFLCISLGLILIAHSLAMQKPGG